MKLPTIKSKQLIKVLEKKDCVFKRQTGSHRIFYCPQKQKIVTVPTHNKEIKRGLLHSIVKELDLSIGEFIKLLKE